MNDALARLDRGYLRSLALRWGATVLAMPVLVPLLQARGLDLAQVGLVLATFAAVTAAAEIPTGGLADAFGRVRATLVADALSIAWRIGAVFAHDLTGFVAAAALGGLARALQSGALDAWYVDARRRLAPAADLQRPLARAGTVSALAIGAATLVGGFLPLLGPALGLESAQGAVALGLPFVAATVLGIVAMLATLPLRDAAAGPAAGRAAARPDRVFAGAWRAWRAQPTLAALALVSGLGGGIVTGYELLFPPELIARWSGAAAPAIGVGFAGAFVASALGQALGGRARGGAPAAGALGFAVVAAATLAALPVLPAPWSALAVIGTLWVAYGALGFTGPALGDAFHRRAPSAQRAVLLSVQSLLAYAVGVGASVGLGAVATAFGTAAAWTVVSVTAGALALALAAVWVGSAARPGASDAAVSPAGPAPSGPEPAQEPAPGPATP